MQLHAASLLNCLLLLIDVPRQLSEPSCWNLEHSHLVSLANLCVREGLQGDQDKHEAEEGRCREHVQSSGPYPPVQQSLLHAV